MSQSDFGKNLDDLKNLYSRLSRRLTQFLTVDLWEQDRARIRAEKELRQLRRKAGKGQASVDEKRRITELEDELRDARMPHEHFNDDIWRKKRGLLNQMDRELTEVYEYYLGRLADGIAYVDETTDQGKAIYDDYLGRLNEWAGRWDAQIQTHAAQVKSLQTEIQNTQKALAQKRPESRAYKSQRAELRELERRLEQTQDHLAQLQARFQTVQALLAEIQDPNQRDDRAKRIRDHMQVLNKTEQEYFSIIQGEVGKNEQDAAQLESTLSGRATDADFLPYVNEADAKGLKKLSRGLRKTGNLRLTKGWVRFLMGPGATAVGLGVLVAGLAALIGIPSLIAFGFVFAVTVVGLVAGVGVAMLTGFMGSRTLTRYTPAQEEIPQPLSLGGRLLGTLGRAAVAVGTTTLTMAVIGLLFMGSGAMIGLMAAVGITIGVASLLSLRGIDRSHSTRVGANTRWARPLAAGLLVAGWFGRFVTVIAAVSIAIPVLAGTLVLSFPIIGSLAAASALTYFTYKAGSNYHRAMAMVELMEELRPSSGLAFTQGSGILGLGPSRQDRLLALLGGKRKVRNALGGEDLGTLQGVSFSQYDGTYTLEFDAGKLSVTAEGDWVVSNLDGKNKLARKGDRNRGNVALRITGLILAVAVVTLAGGPIVGIGLTLFAGWTGIGIASVSSGGLLASLAVGYLALFVSPLIGEFLMGSLLDGLNKIPFVREHFIISKDSRLWAKLHGAPRRGLSAYWDQSIWPLVVGVPYMPGKFFGRIKLWMRRGRETQAPGIPLLSATMTFREAHSTMSASAMNRTLPNYARALGMGFAEDTLVGMPAGAVPEEDPETPAAALSLMAWYMEIMEHNKFNRATARAFMDRKGQGWSLGADELLGESFLKEAFGEDAEDVRRFLKVAPYLQAMRMQQVKMDPMHHAAGIYSYLITAFTNQPVAQELLGPVPLGTPDAQRIYDFVETLNELLREAQAAAMGSPDAVAPEGPLREAEKLLRIRIGNGNPWNPVDYLVPAAIATAAVEQKKSVREVMEELDAALGEQPSADDIQSLPPMRSIGLGPRAPTGPAAPGGPAAPAAPTRQVSPPLAATSPGAATLTRTATPAPTQPASADAAAAAALPDLSGHSVEELTDLYIRNVRAATLPFARSRPLSPENIQAGWNEASAALQELVIRMRDIPQSRVLAGYFRENPAKLEELTQGMMSEVGAGQPLTRAHLAVLYVLINNRVLFSPNDYENRDLSNWLTNQMSELLKNAEGSLTPLQQGAQGVLDVLRLAVLAQKTRPVAGDAPVTDRAIGDVRQTPALSKAGSLMVETVGLADAERDAMAQGAVERAEQRYELVNVREQEWETVQSAEQEERTVKTLDQLLLERIGEIEAGIGPDEVDPVWDLEHRRAGLQALRELIGDKRVALRIARKLPNLLVNEDGQVVEQFIGRPAFAISEVEGETLKITLARNPYLVRPLEFNAMAEDVQRQFLNMELDWYLQLLLQETLEKRGVDGVPLQGARASHTVGATLMALITGQPVSSVIQGKLSSAARAGEEGREVLREILRETDWIENHLGMFEEVLQGPVLRSAREVRRMAAALLSDPLLGYVADSVVAADLVNRVHGAMNSDIAERVSDQQYELVIDAGTLIQEVSAGNWQIRGGLELERGDLAGFLQQLVAQINHGKVTFRIVGTSNGHAEETIREVLGIADNTEGVAVVGFEEISQAGSVAAHMQQEGASGKLYGATFLRNNASSEIFFGEDNSGKSVFRNFTEVEEPADSNQAISPARVILASVLDALNISQESAQNALVGLDDEALMNFFVDEVFDKGVLQPITLDTTFQEIRAAELIMQQV
ncbi:MAG: hypothetical protein JW937_02175 [Candidatus Omnitrophica bacterium]|nr:hypothetical protein [Candidatus Omnitrophota bacterium]